MPLLTLTGSYILRPLDTGGAPRAPSIDQLRQWTIEMENAVDAAYRVGIIDDLPAEGDLPGSGSNGDAYLIDGELWVWLSGAADWFNAGPVAAGATGPAGEAAILNPRGAYDNGTAYVLFDVVTDQGSSWIAKTSTTGNAPPTLPTTSNTQWLLLAEKGATGNTGATGATGPQGDAAILNPRGAYDNGTAYALFDVVTDQGSSWVAKTSTTGNAPPTLPTTSNTQWLLLAEKGDTGATGAPGSGSGDVVGPVSSVDNGLPRFHGTGGKTLQESNAVLDDAGNLAVGADAQAADIAHVLNTAAGQSRLWGGRTGGLLRWLWGVNQTAEGGANAGSDFAIARYNDAGSFIDVCVSIARATGYATFIRLSEGANRVLSVVGGLTLTGGFKATSYAAGTKSSGTFTPDPLNGNFQHATNGGAHTLDPPADPCSIVIEYENNGSAGAITTSGFSKVVGTAPATTNGIKYQAAIIKTNSISSLTWVT